MSTVCSSALLGGLVDLDVLNYQVAGIETLGVSVGLSVVEKAEEELGRLDGPPRAGDTELLSCRDAGSAFCPRSRCPLSVSFSLLPMGSFLPCAARPVPPAYLLMGTASL